MRVRYGYNRYQNEYALVQNVPSPQSNRTEQKPNHTCAEDDPKGIWSESYEDEDRDEHDRQPNPSVNAGAPNTQTRSNKQPNHSRRDAAQK